MKINVVLTREDDTFVELSDRVKVTDKSYVDLFISIHNNAAFKKESKGLPVPDYIKVREYPND